MLWMDYPCPKVDDIYWNQVMVSDPVKQIESDNKEFLDFLLNKTGMARMTLDDVWSVWDPLNCEAHTGRLWLAVPNA